MWGLCDCPHNCLAFRSCRGAVSISYLHIFIHEYFFSFANSDFLCGIVTFKQSTASEPCVTVAGTTAPWETLPEVLKMADYLEKHDQLLVSMAFLLLQAFKAKDLQQHLTEQLVRNGAVFFLNSRLLTLKREWDTVQVSLLHLSWYHLFNNNNNSDDICSFIYSICASIVGIL